MRLTQEQQKAEALKALNTLHIYTPYVKKFDKFGVITQFIDYTGYYIGEYTENGLLAKIREVEKETGVLIYAVVASQSPDGDQLYSMLYIPPTPTEGDINQPTFVPRPSDADEFIKPYWSVCTYTWNATCEYCSDWGYVGLVSAYGGLKRIY